MSLLTGTQGTIGESYGISSSVGQSYGSSANYGYNFGEGSSWEDSYSNSWNLGENWSESNQKGENWSQSYNEGEESSWNRVFGREASAQDIYRAEEANAKQLENWMMQAQYNAKEAEKSRQFQKEMSNTAYQRAVKDLLAAGLNPILAVGNMGASTPTGATASSGLSASHKANTYTESQGGSYGYNHGSSSSYGYNKASSNSYGYNKGASSSESHGGSRNSTKSENWGNSSNSSYNSSYGYDMSKTSNNIAEVAQGAIGALTDVYKSGSATSLYNKAIDKLKGTHTHETGRKLKGGQRTI